MIRILSSVAEPGSLSRNQPRPIHHLRLMLLRIDERSRHFNQLRFIRVGIENRLQSPVNSFRNGECPLAQDRSEKIHSCCVDRVLHSARHNPPRAMGRQDQDDAVGELCYCACEIRGQRVDLTIEYSNSLRTFLR